MAKKKDVDASTGCADDNSPLGNAVKTLGSEQISEIVKEAVGGDVFTPYFRGDSWFYRDHVLRQYGPFPTQEYAQGHAQEHVRYPCVEIDGIVRRVWVAYESEKCWWYAVYNGKCGPYPTQASAQTQANEHYAQYRVGKSKQGPVSEDSLVEIAATLNARRDAMTQRIVAFVAKVILFGIASVLGLITLGITIAVKGKQEIQISTNTIDSRDPIQIS